MASEDPLFLTFVTEYAIHLLTCAGFLISPKSVTLPCLSLSWLGKILSSTTYTLSNDPRRVGNCLFHLWTLRCCKYNFRSLQRFLGSLQWLLCPGVPASHLLARAYSFLFSYAPAQFLPRNLWISLATAVLLCYNGWRPRPIPPPLCMPLLFVDAAPSVNNTFVVAVVRPDQFASILCAPRWVHSLQSAELYSIFHALRLMLTRKVSHACIATDNSASFYTMVHGRIHATPPDRLRIFRRINRLLYDSHIQLQMALVASEGNIADPFTRPGSRSCLQTPHVHTSFRQVSSVLTRFWWTACCCSFPPAVGTHVG